MGADAPAEGPALTSLRAVPEGAEGGHRRRDAVRRTGARFGEALIESQLCDPGRSGTELETCHARRRLSVSAWGQLRQFRPVGQTSAQSPRAAQKPTSPDFGFVPGAVVPSILMPPGLGSRPRSASAGSVSDSVHPLPLARGAGWPVPSCHHLAAARASIGWVRKTNSRMPAKFGARESSNIPVVKAGRDTHVLLHNGKEPFGRSAAAHRNRAHRLTGVLPGLCRHVAHRMRLTMKMLMSLLSIFFLSLGIAGCADNGGSDAAAGYSNDSSPGGAFAFAGGGSGPTYTDPMFGVGDSFGPSYTNVDNGSGY
jgi:hypothetical protein